MIFFDIKSLIFLYEFFSTKQFLCNLKYLKVKILNLKKGNFMKKHFTSTVFIINDEKILLIHHKKMNVWLPPGGHVEENEIPSDTAIREAKEETGLDVEIIKNENIWIVSKEATSFQKPYLCLLENIPKHKNIEAHQHIDLIYLAHPTSLKIDPNLSEINEIKWFSKEDLKSMKSENKLLDNVAKVLDHLFLKDLIPELRHLENVFSLK